MPVHGVRLTAPVRRDKARQAYQLAIRRVTFTEIAKDLDISRQLVSTLVSEEQERQWDDRDTKELEGEKRRSIATYEEVIRGAWQRLGKTSDASLNVSGLFNSIISAQSKIDGITGVEAPKPVREGPGVSVNVNVNGEPDVGRTAREIRAINSHIGELDAEIEEIEALEALEAQAGLPGDSGP